MVLFRVVMRCTLDVSQQDFVIATIGGAYSLFSVALCVFFFSVNDEVARMMAYETLADVAASTCTTVFSIFTIFGWEMDGNLQVDLRYLIMNAVQVASLHCYFVIIETRKPSIEPAVIPTSRACAPDENEE